MEQTCGECLEKTKKTVSGGAFTKFRCRECGFMWQHQNARAPLICRACAVEKGLCRRCGTDMVASPSTGLSGDRP